MKLNCWEFKKCGREVGGTRAQVTGVCPAAIFELADGFCGGKNGGRACVYITGTFCAGTAQGTYHEKQKVCDKCEFYWQLKEEESVNMSVLAFHAYVGSKQKEKK